MALLGSSNLNFPTDDLMNAVGVAQRYFDAWIYRDANGIIAAFTEGGTYSDPTAGQDLSREATAEYARGLWDAFPDLTFEIISTASTGTDSVDNARNKYWVTAGSSAHWPLGRGSGRRFY